MTSASVPSKHKTIGYFVGRNVICFSYVAYVIAAAQKTANLINLSEGSLANKQGK
jgi:hypothetical protein